MTETSGTRPAERLWRRRAMLWMAIWVALCGCLVVFRINTARVRPELLEAQQQNSELVKQRDALSLEVQTLRSPLRVHEWAKANGMTHFADSPKRTANFEALPPQSLEFPQNRVTYSSTGPFEGGQP